MKKIFSILFCAILCCSFMIVPVFAEEFIYPDVSDFLEIESEGANHFAYYVYKQNNSYMMLCFNSSSTADVDFLLKSSNDENFVVKLVDSEGQTYNFNYSLYRVDSGAWNRLTGKTAVTYYNGQNIVNTSSITTTYLESSHNIYYKDGTIFFQGPPTELTLAEAIQMVVEKQIPITKGIIQNQMLTIVLCGVGCLALVISLVLLVRILRRCLPR